MDELVRGGKHFRHPHAAPSVTLLDPAEQATVNLAQDVPDWWGSGIATGTNSSSNSSYVRKHTGILSGGDAWRRFTQAHVGLGSSDSESEADSPR